ncbi:hypothetical protein Tco_0774840 [Tanacetum coccineum]|uniref:Reverse transcriptase domain-containing protein n=1 Tax=Tanacetum coccineum TaxID=301880 RepID=A0ABQ4ZPL4_9ASTR
MEDKRISGVFVGVEKLNISHLFYADDASALLEWNVKEVDVILHVLNEFHAQSGLKINIGKSNLYGVSVDMEDVSNMARASGCAAGSCPFSYLGVNIGANMACRSNWDNVLQRFRNRLSNWKVKM